MAVQAPLNDDCARLIKRLHSRVAELEKTLAEASEEADVRDGEGDTLVGQIKMYIQHRHDLALQNITLRKRVAELEAHRDCSISFRGFRLSGSAESTAEVRRLLRVEERLAELEAAQEWMPIESAPRDGTPLLLTSAAHGMLILVGWYDSELEAWSLWPGEKAYGARIGATHWLPLPSPPKVAT